MKPRGAVACHAVACNEVKPRDGLECGDLKPRADLAGLDVMWDEAEGWFAMSWPVMN